MVFTMEGGRVACRVCSQVDHSTGPSQPTTTDSFLLITDACPQVQIGCLAQLQVGQKLLHGAAEAKESITSFAQGLTSWCAAMHAAAGPHHRA